MEEETLKAVYNRDGELTDDKKLEQHESIKLIKNSRGYGWEIKVFIDKEQHLKDEGHINRLDRLNDYLNDKYGTKPDENA